MRTKTIYGLIGALAWSMTSFAAPSFSVKVDAAAGGCGEFAAGEIRRAAEAAKTPGTDQVSLVVAPASSKPARPQSYSIRVEAGSAGGRVITVRGADAAGAMYGGLDVAEAIKTGTFATLGSSEHSPHILQRGIKLNIPLDLRSPTYSQPGDAAQQNIPVMWEMDYWRELFDDMARHRYNVISLWTLHPFPSLVKVPEFPHVALDDVWRTKEPLDADFNAMGRDFVRPAMLANHEVVKKMTIDEKIKFWREVMQLAKDRGVDIYFFMWNAFFYGAEGKDGVTAEVTAPRNIEYTRDSVRELIRTYPLLAGLGITAGEGMGKGAMGKMGKEDWLWQTYGEGIRDALKDTPARKFRLIHRFHQTALGEIKEAFAELPCDLDLSFKYVVAHMYSVTNPNMIKPVLPLLTPQLRSWLTVRNDDIYSFRWADPEFARAFIKNIPGEDKIAGFYMGSDGFVWGRDFLTKNPGEKRETVMAKQWLSFALWGRLAYEPDLPDATFARLVGARFPGADLPKLMAAWADASKTFPLITRFFWGDIDLKWFPEACRRRQGFYDVRHFMEGGTMPGAGVLNIMDWRAGLVSGKMPKGTTPLEIAAMLHDNATGALASLPALRQAAVPDSAAREYAATLGDIEAMSRLGLYYAAKIRGACELALFDKTGKPEHQAAAVKHLETALDAWKQYSDAYTRQYVQPVFYCRVLVVDLPKQTKNVAQDIATARNWKPGTIDDSKIKRKITEPGFAE